MPARKSIAVVGLGPAGAITIDALAREQAFDVIKVFERREKPGGCWIPDQPDATHELPNFDKLASRTADETLPIPADLPACTPRAKQYRFSETSIYPDLETNICARAMEFSQEPIPDILSATSIDRHGKDSPFRHHSLIQKYIEDLVDRHGYPDLVSFNTTVELAEKTANGWELTLRKEVVGSGDYWYKERFDAVVVASGHYIVPYIPPTKGLAEFATAYPGSVEHSKSFRGAERYKNKVVLTVGSSISGPDIAFALALAVEGTSQIIHSSIHGDRYHPYFGDHAFRHPSIQRHGPIASIASRTVHFHDGTSLPNVDHIIFGTGYSWSLPFLPDVEIRNNRVPGLYLHTFPMNEAYEGLVFVGAVAAGFTFKVYEWQAVLTARYLAGRIVLPRKVEQYQWEQDRIALKGDGVPFTALYPHFEEYFEDVRKLVEQSRGSGGRTLPTFDQDWRAQFDAGHLKRIAWWTRENERSRREKGLNAIEAGESSFGAGRGDLKTRPERVQPELHL